MNITFVSDAIYPYNKGGKEKHLYEISTRLAGMGHDVHIYTMHWWKGAENSRVENGVTLHAISKLYAMYKGDKRTIKQGILFGLACLKLIKVKFEVLDVDHMPFFPIYCAWIVCKLKGKKLYGTWHEALSRSDWTSYMGITGNIAYVIEHLSIKLPYKISAASEHTAMLLGSIHGRSKNVSVIPPGVDISLINSIQPVKKNIDVLYTGRLVKDKNINVLIEAINIAKKLHPKISCVIVGQGIEKNRLESLVRKLKLSKNVLFLEPLESNDVYAYMKAAKVFCLPSVREGFGIVALEAIACGTPVITTNAEANAAKDLIKDNVSGSVTDINAVSFADKISYWLKNTSAIDADKVIGKYDWQKIARSQAKVYA